MQKELQNLTSFIPDGLARCFLGLAELYLSVDVLDRGQTIWKSLRLQL